MQMQMQMQMKQGFVLISLDIYMNHKNNWNK